MARMGFQIQALKSQSQGRKQNMKDDAHAILVTNEMLSKEILEKNLSL